MKDWFLRYWLSVVFGAIVTALSGLYARIVSKYKKRDEKMQQLETEIAKLKDANMASLLFQIMQAHDQYTLRGYITTTELHVIESLNDNYKACGGNGSAHAFMTDLENLSHQPIKVKK